MKKIKPALFEAVLFAGVLSVAPAVADVVTNRWTGTDGASWGTDGNWSLNHVPTGDEYVIFPDTGSSYSINVDGDYEVGCFYVDYKTTAGAVDFTLTGSGRIDSRGMPNASGAGFETHYVRTNRRLVLESGVTLDFRSQGSTAEHVMLYNGLVIKAGATFLLDSIHLHWNGAYVNLEGGRLEVGGYTSYRLNHTIRLEEGSYYSSAQILDASDAETPSLNIVQNGGYATVRRVALSEWSSLTINGGTFNWRDLPEIADGTTLTFNGGTNTFAVAVTDGALARRFLVGNTNTAITVIATGNEALLIDEDCTIKVPLTVGGGLYFTNAVEVTATKEVRLKSIVTASRAAEPHLHFPVVTFVGGFPFQSDSTAPDGSAVSRSFYIEGPTTFRTLADITTRPGRSVYPYFAGDITIDTRDPDDSATVHTIQMDVGVNEDAALAVEGGGTFRLSQTYANIHTPFRKVEVKDGSTLTVLNMTGTTDGPLHTGEFTLGAASTLNLTLSTNSTVYAAEWSVSPTAAINVTVPDTFTTGGKAFLIDRGSNEIPNLDGQISLLGSTDGCTLARSGSNYIAFKKTVTEPDGTYPYEWTGAGSAANWCLVKNWHCGTYPAENLTHVFGAADSVTTPIAEGKLYRSARNDYNGSTIGRLIFRDTALASFTISGTQFTYGARGMSGGSDSSVYSLSPFPQYVAQTSMRSTDSLSFAARADGPIVVSSTLTETGQNRVMYVCGDVRLDGNINKEWAILQLVSANTGNMPQTRLAVMGGTMTITNQTANFTVLNAGFHVAQGATLTFKNGTASSQYRWTRSPQRIEVDGTLDIQAPFYGGVRHVYGGEGTLKIASLKPYSAESSVILTDALTVEVPAEWPTVAATGADTPLRLAARSGRPVISAASGWRYGPAEGVETTTAAADRAAYIHAGATLAVEPGGGTATFADPVDGPGTLEITNGTLKAPGGISSETRIAVAADGAFEWDGTMDFAGLSVAEGGTLVCAASDALTVGDDVSLAGVKLQVASGMQVGVHWKRVLAAKSISGEPVLPYSNWESRVVALDDGTEALEVRVRYGSRLIVR